MTTAGASALSNVKIVAPSDNDILFWSAANNLWQNSALTSLLSGVYATNSNTGVGLNIPESTAGADNTYLGYAAGNQITTGIDNTFLGAGADSTSGNVSDAIAIGYDAKVAGGSTNNIAIGVHANVSSAGSNIAIGNNVVSDSVSGGTVTIGDGAENGGSLSIMIGQNTGSALNEQTGDIFIGAGVGGQIAVGAGVGGNTIIGQSAQTAASSLTNCCVYGYGSGVSAGVHVFETIFGANNSANGDNQTIIGHSNVASTFDDVVMLGNSQTAVEASALYLPNLITSNGATAGGASALPATPQSYLVVYHNGVRKKIPLYLP